MTTVAHEIKFATYPDLAGKTREFIVSGQPVRVTFYGRQDAPDAEIEYRKFTKDFSGYNSRPYVTKKSAYKTMEAAVKAVMKTKTAA